MENFITEYLRLTERAESPTSYIRWGAISCLSATLRDNVWFTNPERLTRLYANTYILILGDSSVVRKATPFNINERLLRGKDGVNNTKVIAGQATMQGVLKHLAETETGAPSGGSGILLAREAGDFFIQDNQTLPTLTNAYDFHPHFDKKLAGFEIPDIKNLCLSLFAGTSEIMIENMLNKAAKEGGFLGRCIVVKETRRRHKDSGFEEDVFYPKEEDWKPMVRYLKDLSLIKGPIEFTLDARRTYNRWYKNWDFEDYYTKTGYEGRMQSHVLKLATILSAAKPTFENKRVETPELEQAIEECNELLMIYKKMTFGSGQAPTSPFLVQVTNLLLDAKNHQMSRVQMMYKLHGNISGKMLDEVIKDLKASEFIIDTLIGGAMGYRLTDSFLSKYKAALPNIKAKIHTQT